MNALTLALFVAAAAVNITLLLLLLSRAAKLPDSLQRELRNELRTERDETRIVARELRSEVSTNIQAMSESLYRVLEGHGTLQQNHYEGMARQLQEISRANQASVELLRTTLDERIKELQQGNESKLEAIRREIGEGLNANGEKVTASLEATGKAQHERLGELTGQVKSLSEANQTELERVRNTLDLRIKEIQESSEKKLDAVQTSVSESLKLTADALEKNVKAASAQQTTQLEAMTQQLREISDRNQSSLESIRSSLDLRVKELQEGNERKLEEMRRTVDEKLQDTLEKRLGESFKFVSDRLEAVHKGLGEMQTLASGVGDLKRVLTNVKARGTWAEVQLGAILDQILTPEQWSKNVCVREGSSERVEYAVRLPGSKEDPAQCMWLAIDSKFPKEDYHRLQAAADAGDPSAVQAATDALIRELRRAAKDIHDKYVNPPSTTDFAIMFLATEGLYAEALRQPAFVEELQQRYRVILAGPTTLAAILSSLRMGFQTLAVEQRATEVWRVLGAVKTEFGKFGGVLEKVKRQLDSATRTIEETGTRTRAIERKLRSVEQLSDTDASELIAIPAPVGEEGETGGDSDASQFVVEAHANLNGADADASSGSH